MLNGTAIGTTNTAAEVMNKITPGDISDPQEVIARGEALSFELGTPITPAFEALVFSMRPGVLRQDLIARLAGVT